MNVVQVLELPADLDILARSAAAEGFHFLTRLRREWQEGRNRFTLPGEALFEARDGGLLLGVCGLNRDPYQHDAKVGRVRHLYVLPEARRRAVGRLLVERVKREAQPWFRVLRVRTSTEEGDLFYRALGFAPTAGDPEATHRLSLDATP